MGYRPIFGLRRRRGAQNVDNLSKTLSVKRFGALEKSVILCQKVVFMTDFKKQGQGLEIHLSEEVAQGNYSNLAIIAHSSSEFIIDFAAVLPGMQKANVHTRVVLTPEHAKRLLLSLQENITRYESNISKIEIHKSMANEDPIMNMGPMGNA